MMDDWTEADDIIEEVRAIRRQIWEEFDNDPRKLLAHLSKLEQNHKGPFIELPDRGSKGKSAA